AQSVEALCGDRPHRLLSRPRRARFTLAHERHVPAAVRGARETVRQGVDGGGLRRPEGAWGGRRPGGPHAHPLLLGCRARPWNDAFRLVRTAQVGPDATIDV